ncbi:MAG TPA: long-chain fatty acid--CoA ligase [Dermatophilaceae bacterium]|nr:long-chain fatty acid--CoA ligase [Dermatophilaceae bacterium]
MLAGTIPLMVGEAVRAHGSRTAQGIWRHGQWQSTSYARFGHQVRDVAAALIRTGLVEGDRVAILARNCPEWTVADVGALLAGCVTVSVYTTSPAAGVRHILNDSGARVVFVGTQTELGTVLQVWPDCPRLELVVVLNGTKCAGAPHCLTWEDFLAGAPERVHGTEVDRRVSRIAPDALATLIYSPGTTGAPKGVMLTHANVLSQIAAIDDRFTLFPGERNLSVLPLAHAYERVWSYMLIYFGMQNVYVPDPRGIRHALQRVRPHALVSTPRLYHRVHETVERRVRAASGGSGRFEWAVRIGVEVQQARSRGYAIAPGLRAQHAAAHWLVLRHVREAIGGPKRLLSCGGSSLNPRTSELFFAAGVPIYHGYGQIETTAMTTCNSPEDLTFDTVGRAVRGCQLRILASGEILVRGSNVMAGYFGQTEETAAVLVDGWYHTGDMGYLTREGNLIVTDRLADRIVTAHGTTVAPQPLERAMMAHPFVERAVVIGENRQYLTTLIQPAFTPLARHAERQGWRFRSRSELLAHPRVLGIFTRLVAEAGSDLDAHIRLRTFRLLDEALTETHGDLSPTEGLRRAAVAARFASVIEHMYAEVDD